MTMAKAEKKAVVRIYVVKETAADGKTTERLVRAGSQAQAIRHVVIGRFDAETASTEDVARLVGDGAEIQTAGEEA